MSWSIIFSGSSARSWSALMLALASWAMRPRTVCFSTMRSCLSVSAGDRCWSGLRRSEAAAPSTAAAAAAERAAHSPGPASAAEAAAEPEAAAEAAAAEHLVEQDAAEDERPRAPAERPARRAAADAWALLVLQAGDVGLGELLGLHGELFGLWGYRKAGGRLGGRVVRRELGGAHPRRHPARPGARRRTLARRLRRWLRGRVAQWQLRRRTPGRGNGRLVRRRPRPPWRGRPLLICADPTSIDHPHSLKGSYAWLRSRPSWAASPSSPRPTSTHSWTAPRTRRR